MFPQRGPGGALNFFRAAQEQTGIDDIYQGRYTPFHGLARVHLGDRNGVKLCRAAAVGERCDAGVYCTLAVAEHTLGFRERLHGPAPRPCA